MGHTYTKTFFVVIYYLKFEYNQLSCILSGYYIQIKVGLPRECLFSLGAFKQKLLQF